MSGAFVLTDVEPVRKFHALAERRRDYFVELYHSERWRRYFSEQEFRAHLRDVIQNVETWAKVLESTAALAPSQRARPDASLRA
jgi:uncharacterized repeat protein (TIGR03809 family)